MAQLFSDFEVNNAPWWPRLSRLIGGSFAIHLILAAVALYVPAVRSMLNIAGEFGGAQYGDWAYKKTRIGERATIIEFPKEKFSYPEGYFLTGKSAEEIALLEAEQAQIMETAAPPVPFMPRISRPARPLAVPKPSPSPDASPSPQASPSPGGAEETARSKEDEEKDKQLDKIAEQNGLKRPHAINKRPFTDWLAKASEMKNKGEINLDGTVEMVFEAEGIDKDGSLINPETTQKSGDPKLQELANELIAALSASGALDFLGGTGRLTLHVKLDETNVAATVTTEMTSEDEASKRALGYNSLITTASIFKSGGEEAATIYKNTKVTSNGKQIVLEFSLPRAEAGAMLKKQIPAG